MRMIGQLGEEKAAQRFSDALYIRGIQNEVEPESDNTWSVWIHDEEELENAAALLEKFKGNPDDAGFRVDSAKVRKQKEAEAKEHEAFQKRIIDGRQAVNRFGGYRAGPFTIFLIVCSVLVALISQLGSNIEPITGLFVSKYISGPLFSEILNGQVWRVFTPMFIHYGILHIAFNMMWLFQLGSLIENRQGTLFFALLVLAVSAGSNVAQYLVSGPSFGGMSGVVFGLFGYIWTKMKFDPNSGYFIDPTTVMWLVAWFFICAVGIVGNIANTAHAVGLGLGMLWGFLNSKYGKG